MATAALNQAYTEYELVETDSMDYADQVVLAVRAMGLPEVRERVRG